MNVLVIDIGGTNIKFLATGQEESRKFPSGRSLTPAAMVSQLQELTQDWNYDVVAIGYPGLVLKGHIVKDPNNLAPGWIGFDFEAALGRPVKIINDAAMQALGSYQGGTMLFLSLGTGLGSALVVNGVVVPMELGHLAYKKGTFEQY
ncbi:MAG: Polyphosphate glucokinase, partial [Cyanobacteriota bacterium]